MNCVTSTKPTSKLLPILIHKPRTQAPLSLHLQPLHNNSKYPKKQGKNNLHLLKPFINLKKQSPNFSTTKWMRRSSAAVEEVGGEEEMVWGLCGFGYWMQGFRCFPWLGLNFHMANGPMALSPSALQLVQQTGNLPMVAKPLFGLLSDAVYVGTAHRVPYISIGVFLQAVSWGTLALIPSTGGTFPTLVACILLTNLGASITEVVTDALVAELSKTQKNGELQSYAFIALSCGALLANLSGGFFLLKTQEPKTMFLTFAFLLSIQLALSLTTKETSLPSQNLACSSISENLHKQFHEVVIAINEEMIFYPLIWIVASTALVPLLSGSLFCFQTQCLKLDPSVIGLSKVVGQFMIISAAVLYNRYLKLIPMRSLISGVQIVYALSFLFDLFFVKQFNLKWGISNEVYVLCFAALAEAVQQFRVLPFTVLFSRLCPKGCEGSLFAFFSSVLCLSSIVSGVLGVGLASFVGVSSGDYSGLAWGIMVQFLAALIPLGWVGCLPDTRNMEEMKVVRTRKKA